MQMITTIAKMSSDLKNVGAPEWTYNLGYIMGIILVLSVVLWLGIMTIKKVLASNARKAKGKLIKAQDGRRLNIPMIIGLMIGGTTIVAIIVGSVLPINSVARNVCVGIVGFNISLVVVLWVIAKLKTHFLYKNWKAEQEKQEIKKKGKK